MRAFYLMAQLIGLLIIFSCNQISALQLLAVLRLCNTLVHLQKGYQVRGQIKKHLSTGSWALTSLNSRCWMTSGAMWE